MTTTIFFKTPPGAAQTSSTVQLYSRVRGDSDTFHLTPGAKLTARTSWAFETVANVTLEAAEEEFVPEEVEMEEEEGEVELACFLRPNPSPNPNERATTTRTTAEMRSVRPR